MQHGGAPPGRAQRSNRLLGQGLLALALGGLFLLATLLVPLLVGPGGPIAPAAGMLQLPGLLLVAVGALLLLSHVIVRRRAIRAWAHTHLSPHFPLMEWTPELLQALAPAQFEALCIALFQHTGLRLRSRIRADNGALDLRLKPREPRAAVALVRCMYLPAGEIGVPQLLHFYGVMTAHTLKRGTFATNASFSAEALRFARDNGIEALDGADLLALVDRRTVPEQQALMRTVLR